MVHEKINELMWLRECLKYNPFYIWQPCILHRIIMQLKQFWLLLT